VGTVRVADESALRWQGSDQARTEALLARGIVFTPEELAGRTREHHAGSEAEPELFEVQFGPDTVVHSHAHLCDEIIYVISGQLILGSRVLDPGSSVYIAGQTLYSFKAGPQGVHFVNFRPRSGAGYLSKDEFMAQRGSDLASG
jgi:mannose-6-phosphate isomerase-like protein (cupin superfamily)